jgi:membrane associated rhomboid family serine protease
MIFPFLMGFLHPRRAPVTWALVILQVLVFLFFFELQLRSQHEIETLASDPTYMATQGRLYARHVIENSRFYKQEVVNLSREALTSSLSSTGRRAVQQLGDLAWRDGDFVRSVHRQLASEDPIMSKWWWDRFSELEKKKSNHPTYMLGVVSEGESHSDAGVLGLFNSAVTYQFSHGSMGHLFSNMIFLVLFGCALEVSLGGLMVLLIFLGSGIVAAFTYHLLDGAAAIPLVGASGAVSGLMAVYAALHWRTGVRFLYFLLVPQRGYMGFVTLPGWTIVFFWALLDLAGHIASPSGAGGVAYSAHLGGEAAGLILGLGLLAVRSLLPARPPLPVQTLGAKCSQ